MNGLQGLQGLLSRMLLFRMPQLMQNTGMGGNVQGINQQFSPLGLLGQMQNYLPNLVPNFVMNNPNYQQLSAPLPSPSPAPHPPFQMPRGASDVMG